MDAFIGSMLLKTARIIAAAERIFFSPVVLGELMFGFRNGTRFKENMDELDQFMRHETVEFIQIGRVTADRYSRLLSFRACHRHRLASESSRISLGLFSGFNLQEIHHRKNRPQ
jgi:hypothetical protein